MLSKIIVHKVGNKINQESLILSQEELKLEDDMKELLQDFFLKNFKSEEQFRFYSDSYLVNNPVYSSVSEIFEDKNKFVWESENLAKHLYEITENPRVQSGELFIVYFEGEENADGNKIDSIGIFKTENKNPFLKIFPQNESFENSTEDLLPSKNPENVGEKQKQIIDENTPIYLVENSEENIVNQTTESVNLESIRKTQLQQKQQNESVKLQIALDYTRNQFALYVTDEDLDTLCNAVCFYSKKEEIPNGISVHTKELSNLDLYHFGWNLWNYFRPIKQEEISKLLKTVFVSLDDIDFDSIKSHLKDEPQKGNIKIQEDLTDYQRT